jgi:hypothetical protein
MTLVETPHGTVLYTNKISHTNESYQTMAGWGTRFTAYEPHIIFSKRHQNMEVA